MSASITAAVPEQESSCAEAVESAATPQTDSPTNPQNIDSLTLFEQVREHIYRHSNSRNRMDMLLDYCPHLVPYGLGKNIIRYSEWLQLLGEHWTGCDIVTPYSSVLKRVLGVRGPLREMMDEAENAAYDALPKIVNVYRGCDADGPKGICWSLDQQVANSFPFATRFKAKTPVVIRARAKKSRILALKLDRGEAEVITFSPRRIEIKAADELAAKAVFEARHAWLQAWRDSGMKKHAALLAYGADVQVTATA